jgi:hypothetical protein
MVACPDGNALEEEESGSGTSSRTSGKEANGLGRTVSALRTALRLA